jgi:hypothetical protein
MLGLRNNSVTERHSDDVLFWLDPDNEWLLREVDEILRAIAGPPVHRPRTHVIVAPAPRVPYAVRASAQCRRLWRMERDNLGRTTQRAPPLNWSRDIAALDAERSRQEVSSIDGAV